MENPGSSWGFKCPGGVSKGGSGPATYLTCGLWLEGGRKELRGKEGAPALGGDGGLGAIGSGRSGLL